MPQPSSDWCSDHSLFYRSCCADLWLHNTEIAYTCTIWESFTCCLILAVDFKPIKEAGRLVFPCCIAAISTAFDLKNASPLFFLSALMMTHTPAHPAEISSHAPEREKEERDVFFYVPLTHTIAVCVSWSTCSVYANTRTHQHSLWFPAGWKFSWCFCTARPLSVLCIYSGKLFSYLRPRGFRSAFKFIKCI